MFMQQLVSAVSTPVLSTTTLLSKSDQFLQVSDPLMTPDQIRSYYNQTDSTVSMTTAVQETLDHGKEEK